MPVQYIPHPIRATITYPVRALDTTYQNLGLRPILVMVTVSARCNAAVLAQAFVMVLVDPAWPPAINVAATGLPALTRAHDERDYSVISFLVPPGQYYRLMSNVLGVGTTLTAPWWQEVQL